MAVYRYRLLIANGILLAGLLGGAGGRRVENAVPSRTDFLRPLGLPFRGWKTRDLALDPSELALLKPDATLVRDYTGPNGQRVQLAVIAGHRKQSVHTPGFCMTGGGWEITSQEPYRLKLPDRSVDAVRAKMVKDGQQLLVTYCFTDGEYATRSLPRFQWMQLVKRFGTRLPIGALVRVIAPVRGSVKEAEAVSDAFAAATLPAVFGSLRATHLEAR